MITNDKKIEIINNRINFLSTEKYQIELNIKEAELDTVAEKLDIDLLRQSLNDAQNKINMLQQEAASLV